MNFIIDRASYVMTKFEDQEKPCNKAVEGTYLKNREDWKCWRVEINSLEDLLDIINEEEEIIICSTYDNQYEIMIHDDYLY